MSLDISEYFGSYDESNIDQLVRYIKKMDENLEEVYNFGKPFMKGNTEFKYADYLSDRNLNEKPTPANELFKYTTSLFQNLPNWDNPGTMINVIPPVNHVSMAVSFFAMLHNANIAQDTYAGFSINAELEVSKYISELIGWDWRLSRGAFTFGGKGTNLYAAKIALSKASPDSVNKGVDLSNHFMVTSENAHPCHYEVCNWIGIGKDNCIEIPCDAEGKMDLQKADAIIRSRIESGGIFIGFNLNGGSTNELYIDPIKDVYQLNKQLVNDYGLSYKPHIHVDAVLSWVYLFFGTYDYAKNPLDIKESILQKISLLSGEVDELKYADSVGIDFHKTGFCPYISSLFIAKSSDDFNLINGSQAAFMDDMHYGEYNPYQTTLELSRSPVGAISALISLKSFGIEGFQEILSKMLTTTDHFRNLLLQRKQVCLINPDTPWLATFFVIKPEKYRDLTLDELLNLNTNEVDFIKQYNIGYAKFVLEKGRKGEISFTYTSSRSYKVPGSDISLGAIKAYPISPFLNVSSAERVFREVIKSIEEYEIYSKSIKDKDEGKYISDEMVYRDSK